MIQALHNLMKLGEANSSSPAPKSTSTRRNSFGGVPSHTGQRNWRYAILQGEDGKQQLRLSAGDRVLNWDITAREKAQAQLNEPIDAIRTADVDKLEEGEVVSKGVAQVHKSSPNEIHATLQDGKRNSTFKLTRRESGEDGKDNWSLFVSGKKDSKEQSAVKFVEALREKTAAAVAKPMAVIIKGNPKWVDGPHKEKAGALYAAIQTKLQEAGYDVTTDPGEPHTSPDETAALWVGHSRGSDRLRFAPENTRTLRVDDFQEPYDPAVEPNDAHYAFTPQLEKALREKTAGTKLAMLKSAIVDRSALPFRESAEAILLDDDKVVAQIANGIDGNQFLKLPGGGVDQGESHLKAVRREALEEAGTTPQGRLKYHGASDIVWPPEFRGVDKKRQERYDQFQGSRRHVYTGLLGSQVAPTSQEGDDWNGDSRVPLTEAIKLVESQTKGKAGPQHGALDVSEQRVIQLRALRHLLNKKLSKSAALGDATSALPKTSPAPSLGTPAAKPATLGTPQAKPMTLGGGSPKPSGNPTMPQADMSAVVKAYPQIGQAGSVHNKAYVDAVKGHAGKPFNALDLAKQVTTAPAPKPTTQPAPAPRPAGNPTMAQSDMLAVVKAHPNIGVAGSPENAAYVKAVRANAGKPFDALALAKQVAQPAVPVAPVKPVVAPVTPVSPTPKKPAVTPVVKPVTPVTPPVTPVTPAAQPTVAPKTQAQPLTPYGPEIQSRPKSVISQRQILQKAYGDKTDEVIAQARNYQSANPRINFRNEVTDAAIDKPIVIEPMNSIPGASPDTAAQANSTVNETGRQQLSDPKLRGVSADGRDTQVQIRKGLPQREFMEAVDHEVGHGTQKSVSRDRRPNRIWSGAGGGKDDWTEYMTDPNEVQARTSRLNRIHVANGGQFPGNPEDAKKILKLYGLDPRSPTQSKVHVPKDVLDLRDAYKSMSPAEQQEFFDTMASEMPGLSSNDGGQSIGKFAGLDTTAGVSAPLKKLSKLSMVKSAADDVYQNLMGLDQATRGKYMSEALAKFKADPGLRKQLQGIPLPVRPLVGTAINTYATKSPMELGALAEKLRPFKSIIQKNRGLLPPIQGMTKGGAAGSSILKSILKTYGPHMAVGAGYSAVATPIAESMNYDPNRFQQLRGEIMGSDMSGERVHVPFTDSQRLSEYASNFVTGSLGSKVVSSPAIRKSLSTLHGRPSLAHGATNAALVAGGVTLPVWRVGLIGPPNNSERKIESVPRLIKDYPEEVSDTVADKVTDSLNDKDTRIALRGASRATGGAIGGGLVGYYGGAFLGETIADKLYGDTIYSRRRNVSVEEKQDAMNRAANIRLLTSNIGAIGGSIAGAGLTNRAYEYVSSPEYAKLMATIKSKFSKTAGVPRGLLKLLASPIAHGTAYSLASSATVPGYLGAVDSKGRSGLTGFYQNSKDLVTGKSDGNTVSDLAVTGAPIAGNFVVGAASSSFLQGGRVRRYARPFRVQSPGLDSSIATRHLSPMRVIGLKATIPASIYAPKMLSDYSASFRAIEKGIADEKSTKASDRPHVQAATKSINKTLEQNGESLIKNYLPASSAPIITSIGGAGIGYGLVSGVQALIGKYSKKKRLSEKQEVRRKSNWTTARTLGGIAGGIAGLALSPMIESEIRERLIKFMDKRKRAELNSTQEPESKPEPQGAKALKNIKEVLTRYAHSLAGRSAHSALGLGVRGLALGTGLGIVSAIRRGDGLADSLGEIGGGAAMGGLFGTVAGAALPLVSDISHVAEESAKGDGEHIKNHLGLGGLKVAAPTTSLGRLKALLMGRDQAEWRPPIMDESLDYDAHDQALRKYLKTRGFGDIKEHIYEPGGSPWSMTRDGKEFEFNPGYPNEEPEPLESIYGQGASAEEIYRKGPGLALIGGGAPAGQSSSPQPIKKLSMVKSAIDGALPSAPRPAGGSPAPYKNPFDTGLKTPQEVQQFQSRINSDPGFGASMYERSRTVKDRMIKPFRQAFGRVVTNIAEPLGYRTEEKYSAIYKNPVGSLRAITQDRPIYDITDDRQIAARDQPYREGFDLEPRTKYFDKKYTFDPTNNRVGRHLEFNSRAQAPGWLPLDEIINPNTPVDGGISMVRPDQGQVSPIHSWNPIMGNLAAVPDHKAQEWKYDDSWDFKPKSGDTESGWLRSGVNAIHNPISIKGSVPFPPLNKAGSFRLSMIKSAIDSELRERIAAAESKVDTNPSEAQKESEVYRKGHVWIQGLDITIENPKGSTRTGTSKGGKKWSTTMANSYGYIRGQRSEADGDHVDVFLGDHPESQIVFIVDQVNPSSGRFDEHKALAGFNNAADARAAYLANYEKGWKGLGNITSLTMDQFKAWLEKGDTGKPLKGQNLESFVKKAATNPLDIITYPISGESLPGGLLAGAGAGVGVGVLGHYYRKAKRKLVGSEEDEGDTMLSSALKGGLLGGALTAGYRMIDGLSGLSGPVGKSFDSQIPKIEREMDRMELKWRGKVPVDPKFSDGYTGDINTRPDNFNQRTASIKLASMGGSDVVSLIESDTRLSYGEKQRILDQLRDAARRNVPMDPQQLAGAGFGALAAWIASRAMGFGPVGQAIAAAVGGGLGSYMMRPDPNIRYQRGSYSY